MLENIRFAFQGIMGHKLRSFLTMLGVIIGIASIIAIVSTIKGTNEQIMQNLIGAGNNNVKVTLKQGSDDYWMDSGLPDGVTVLTDEQKERIRSLSQVADASFYYSRSYVQNVKSGKNSLDAGTGLGVDSHYLSATGYEVYSGRPFVESDYKNGRKVILLDEMAADSLFPNGGALGKTVDIMDEPFTVVGLIRKSSDSQPDIESFSDYETYHQEDLGEFLMPDTDWPIIFQYDEPQNCVVRAKNVNGMSAAGKKTEEIMNETITNTKNNLTFKADDLLEKAKNKQELSNSTNSLLIWVASIALLVGGIGVMNIMLVSVTERTNEIGLKKALGARKKRILAQFLTESAVLTSLGGILGVAAGCILAFVISKTSGTPVAISIPAIILGVAFSMVIGIVFGILPSIKAANLNPIDALRRE